MSPPPPLGADTKDQNYLWYEESWWDDSLEVKCKGDGTCHVNGKNW